MSQSKIYSPRIQEDLIPILWKISKFKKKPMTKVVDEILRPELARLSADRRYLQKEDKMSMTHEEFERALKEELTAALSEKRQPNCPSCKQPLELMYKIGQYTSWIWDKDEAKYIQIHDLGEAESDPKCDKCGFESCSFLEDMADDSELKALLTKLGLCF